MNDKQMAKSETSSLEKMNSNRTRWFSPAVDIYEVEDELVLRADVPGVEDGGVEIQVERGVLTLEAMVEHDERQKGYYRQFKLSDRIDADAGSADLRDGVLTLRLPKSEEAKPKRINVQTLH